MGKKEAVEAELKKLKGTGGIDGAAVVSRDGLIISSILEPGFDSEVFGAMSATMNGAAETALAELGRGAPDRVMAESPKGKLIAVGAGESAILVVLASPDSQLGMLFVSIKKSAKKITGVLGE